MIKFQSYLTEAAASEEKLTHLEHAEDHVINSGLDVLASFRLQTKPSGGVRI